MKFLEIHNVHHRAQLGVYLRLNDIPVLAVYGPRRMKLKGLSCRFLEN